MRRIFCDILVVGGGGAGAMAAYEATKHKVKVVLVTKGKIQRSGCTIMAPGAIAGVDKNWSIPGDSLELHIRDTLQGGSYLNEQNLVKKVIQESPKVILEMESIGALWQRKEDGIQYDLRSGGGHTFPRSVFLEDRTGKELMRALVGELRGRNVQIIENVMILRLLHDGNDIVGAIGINLTNLELILFESNTVILATGGAGNVYENTDNPIDITGDGYALAYQEGLPLMDMEFVQFYPIAFLDPPSLKGELAGLIDYSRLLNSHKERFMYRYDPERLENSTRDRVTRAIFQEILEGRGTANGGVYCDLTFHETGFIRKATPALNKTYKQINIDPEKDLFEIAPTCHFFMGGLVVNEDWQTGMNGLFAVGEVCTGVHGTNRLSQNALAEILVSGKYAGMRAAEASKGQKEKRIHPKEILQDEEIIKIILKSNGGIAKPPKFGIHSLEKRLKKIMWCNAGILRTKKKLLGALDEIESLQEDLKKVSIHRHYYPNWELLKYLETKNLLLVSRMIILSSLERKESRGAHYREDYPEKNDYEWLKHILITKKNNQANISYKAVDQSLEINKGNENEKGNC